MCDSAGKIVEQFDLFFYSWLQVCQKVKLVRKKSEGESEHGINIELQNFGVDMYEYQFDRISMCQLE